MRAKVPLPRGLAGGIFCCIELARFRRTAIRNQKARINRRIRVPQVRLIDEEGRQIGVISTSEALMMAEERGLDLVEVAPNADPPVCRLMDYGKFLYEQNKKAREARKNQKTIEVKEVQIRPSTDEHDVEVKSNRAREFLSDGHKVKFNMRFRGRQLAHMDIGVRMLEDIAERLRDVGVVEVRPTPEGRSITMVLAPQSAKAAAKPRPERSEGQPQSERS
ncbi:translation initiation factor IF-3 [Kallotenue papyrolyticum]|uniref:translation initiation factor IF-3 n=1 Tax=Kallotenue papyrolyticum TaxID=1325125 RepID=UPI0004786693